MSLRTRTALIIAGLAVVAAPLVAHHSFATYYFEEDTVEINGIILEFQYRNPHSWIHVEGQEGLNKPRHYAAEWAGTSRLERDNIDKNTLRAGDSVTLWGSPSRDVNENKIHLKRIRRSDGWQWGMNRNQRPEAR